MSNERTERMLRAQAWERAKGELNSMLHTYYPRYHNGKEIPNNYAALENAMTHFIKLVEDHELYT